MFDAQNYNDKRWHSMDFNLISNIVLHNVACSPTSSSNKYIQKDLQTGRCCLIAANKYLGCPEALKAQVSDGIGISGYPLISMPKTIIVKSTVPPYPRPMATPPLLHHSTAWLSTSRHDRRHVSGDNPPGSPDHAPVPVQARVSWQVTDTSAGHT